MSRSKAIRRHALSSIRWSPTGYGFGRTSGSRPKGVDGFKLNSDVKLAAKVALQKAGVVLGLPPVSVLVPREVPVAMRRAVEEGPNHEAPNCVTADQARANLRHDSHAAATASAETDDTHVNLMEHALNVSEDRIGDEGENLLDEDSEEKETANTAVSSA